MICVPIVEKTVPEMVETAKGTETELVELRLDYLRDFEGMERLAGIKKKKIITCMPEWEGGRFSGAEEERISLLLKTVDFADYVTIELKTEKNLRDTLIKKAKKKKVKVIVAFHDFRKTPGKRKILEILKLEEEAGADIAKIAFMPKTKDDVITVMAVLAENKLEIPLVALSMGELGSVSRVLGPLLGSYMTFASISDEKKSAPGQLTVNELKKILK